MKKAISILLSLLMLASLPVFAEEDAGTALLEAVRGTYDELFTVICDPEYDQLWLDSCSAVIGEEAAPMAAEMLKAACTGTIYGQEAIDAYGDGSEGAQFDCYFINGVAQFIFDGAAISGVDAAGEVVFSHEYACAGELSIAGMMDGYLYETADEDAGEFSYFLLLPDTPESTYHIEFRYGSDVEALTLYNEGDYAYWLAAGILEDRDEAMVENVIDLFCTENLAELEAESAGEAVVIETAEQLAAIADDLAGNYVLGADIDLGGAAWTPIGAFQPMGEEGEAAETPTPALAFTGSFDGAGHTVSNLVVDQPDGFCMGLFGCIAGARVANLTVENARVDGAMMVGAVVGYAYDSVVSNVTLTGDNTVTGHPSEMGSGDMIGGVVGAGMDSLIANCTASAAIVVPDGGSNAGIVGGGLEVTSVTGCAASGSVTAGDGCYGLGGVSGCGFGSELFADNRAENVTVTAGADADLIGGIVGYAGGYENPDYGIAVTEITGCSAQGVTIEAASATPRVGGVIGGGFYFEAFAAYGAPFDAPTTFTLEDCASDATLNGDAVEPVGAPLE